jgi:hypothetical protein
MTSKKYKRKLKLKRDLPQYGLGGDIFGGASAGASAGSVAGPWGVAAGALVGATAGYIGGKKKEKAAERAEIYAQKAKDVQQAFADYTPTGQSYDSIMAKGGKVKSKKTYSTKHIMAAGGEVPPGSEENVYFGDVFQDDGEEAVWEQDYSQGYSEDPAAKMTALDERVARTVSPRGYSDDFGQIFNKLGNFISGKEYESDDDYRDELWRYSLGGNEPLNNFEESKYRPTGSDDTSKYLSIKNLSKNDPKVLQRLLEMTNNPDSVNITDRPLELTDINKAYFNSSKSYGTKDFDKMSDAQLDNVKNMYSNTDVLGNYKVSRGNDDKGSYISIYDKWDLANPLANSYLDRIPEIYDRIYYKQNKDVDSQREAGKVAYDYLPIDDTNEYAMGGNIRQKYAMGGNVPVELEGGESGVSPDGQDFNVEGPSHANGGVPMELPEGTDVYSDQLKKEGTNKTYSQLNKQITNRLSKYENTMKDPNTTGLSKKTARLMINKLKGQQKDLFVDQEKSKYQKGGFNSKYKFEGGGNVGTVASALPALYNIGQGLFGKADTRDPGDYMNYSGMAAAKNMYNQKYDISNQLDASRRATAVGKHNVRSAAGGRQDLIGGYAALAGQRAMNDSNAYAQKHNMESQYRAQGAQMQATVGAQNAQTRMSIADYNAKAEAAQQGYLQEGMSQLSGVAQQYQKTKNQQSNDAIKLEMLKQMFPNFNI